jgi:hypothetical protein
MITLTGSSPRKNKELIARRWILLIGIFVCMYFFVGVGLPFLSEKAGFTEEHQKLIEADIHAGEWFYIFVEQIYEIAPRIDNTMKYTPGI